MHCLVQCDESSAKLLMKSYHASVTRDVDLEAGLACKNGNEIDPVLCYNEGFPITRLSKSTFLDCYAQAAYR
jgi:hypothetical protein